MEIDHNFWGSSSKSRLKYRRKARPSGFKPDSEFIAKKTADFLANNGTIRGFGDEVEQTYVDQKPLRIAAGIKFYREQAKLTQKQLKEKSGVSQAAISRYETAQIVATDTSLRKIAKALNVFVEDIVFFKK